MFHWNAIINTDAEAAPRPVWRQSDSSDRILVTIWGKYERIHWRSGGWASAAVHLNDNTSVFSAVNPPPVLRFECVCKVLSRVRSEPVASVLKLLQLCCKICCLHVPWEFYQILAVRPHVLMLMLGVCIRMCKMQTEFPDSDNKVK